MTNIKKLTYIGFVVNSIMNHIKFFVLIFILFCLPAYPQINSVSNLAPKSKIPIDNILSGFETNDYVIECLHTPFQKQNIKKYEKLIYTGIAVLKGYSSYKGIKNSYNFLNSKGMNLLNEFYRFYGFMNSNTLDWEAAYDDFLIIIQKIPRASINHSTWNLDLFIDVFENMNNDEIKCLFNPANKISIQLSRTCPNNCLHCAALAKDRKLSSIEHMPLPIALKLINKIASAGNPLFLLYDRSDIAYYYDNVLKMDALPIMHFMEHKNLSFSSITQGSNESADIFLNYLPLLISFHPFHRITLNYIKNKIKYPNRDFSDEKNKIIKHYISKFLDVTKMLDFFPYYLPFHIYEGGKGAPITSFRKYKLSNTTRNIIKKDSNGQYALSIINELLKLQNEIFEEFMNRFNKTRGLLAIIDDETDIYLEFTGAGAFFLKSLGISDKTIYDLKQSPSTNLYNNIDYVIEADGRISIITPERYKEKENSPHRKVKDIFIDKSSEDFKIFCTILKIISSGKIEKLMRLNPYFNKLCKILNISKFKIDYNESSALISKDSKNFINLIKYFILKDEDIIRALSNLKDENLTFIYDKISDLPMPSKLHIFELNDFFGDHLLIPYEIKKIDADIYFHRKAFDFKFGVGFKPENISTGLSSFIINFNRQNQSA